MARPTNASRIMNFDVRGFTHDLDKAMKKATREIANELIKQARKNVSAIPFKNNPVKVLNGDNVEITSDAKRKAAVLRSIRAIGESKVTSTGQGVIKSTVGALGMDDWKEAHIGLYYEFGTGEKAIDMGKKANLPMAGALGTLNKYRTGKQIVSRSKHVDYCGMGKGIWRDMGGNVRVTGSREAGRHTPGFVKYVGEDVKAYQWFKRAVEEVGSNRTEEIIRRNLATVNPIKYLHIAPVIKL